MDSKNEVKIVPFFQAIKRAEEEGSEKLKDDCLSIVKIAAVKSWQAGAWILERRFPEIFALKTRTEISGYLESSENEAERKEREKRVREFLAEIQLAKSKKV